MALIPVCIMLAWMKLTPLLRSRSKLTLIVRLLSWSMMCPSMINPLFKSCDSMRYYEMKDGVFTCVVETSGSTAGSMEFNFNTGYFHAHKPETMRNVRWLYYLIGFINICRRMVRSVPVNDLDLE